MANGRTILFLQGPPSPFWHELATAFEAGGHRVLKINFCFGDWLYWRRPGALTYRGPFAAWRRYLSAFISRHGVTDILYYADRQPYHAAAREVALEAGIPACVVENGYLRPDWITLERGGMSAYSHFPNDPQKIIAAATKAPSPSPPTRYPTSFAHEMFHEIAFHAGSYFFHPLFPAYRADRYYSPFTDYLVGALRQLRLPSLGREAARIAERFTHSGAPFHLAPLQLQSDYQIRDNSPFRHIAEMIEHVIASFAAHASRGGRLLFKVHPYDNGYENWGAVVRRAAAAHGVEERIATIDGGNLRTLMAAARGVVVVNSTAGLQAIQQGRPTKALGAAIYDMPGLTHQGALDTFWREPEPVDRALAAAFVRSLTASTQVNGSFFNRDGRAAAISQIVARIIGREVNEPDAFETRPPRL